jgi:hypothetical protein
LLAFRVPTAPADHGKPQAARKKIRNAFFSCAPEGRAPSSAPVPAARDTLAGRDTTDLKNLCARLGARRYQTAWKHRFGRAVRTSALRAACGSDKSLSLV